MNFTTIIKNNEPVGRRLIYLGKFIEAQGLLIIQGCVPMNLPVQEQKAFYSELHGGAISAYYVTDVPCMTTDKMESFLSDLRKAGPVKPLEVKVAPIEPVVPSPVNPLLERTKPVQLTETQADALTEGALFKEGSMETYSAPSFAMTGDDADSFKAREAITTQPFDGVYVEVTHNGANPEQLISIVDPAQPRTRGRKKA